MSTKPPTDVKAAARSVLDSMPDDVSWDEVHYRLYVREQIEAGLADSDAGRVVDSDQIRQRLDEQRAQSSD